MSIKTSLMLFCLVWILNVCWAMEPARSWSWCTLLCSKEAIERHERVENKVSTRQQQRDTIDYFAACLDREECVDGKEALVEFEVHFEDILGVELDDAVSIRDNETMSENETSQEENNTSLVDTKTPETLYDIFSDCSSNCLDRIQPTQYNSMTDQYQSMATFYECVISNNCPDSMIALKGLMTYFNPGFILTEKLINRKHVYTSGLNDKLALFADSDSRYPWRHSTHGALTICSLFCSERTLEKFINVYTSRPCLSDLQTAMNSMESCVVDKECIDASDAPDKLLAILDFIWSQNPGYSYTISELWQHVWKRNVYLEQLDHRDTASIQSRSSWMSLDRFNTFASRTKLSPFEKNVVRSNNKDAFLEPRK